MRFKFLPEFQKKLLYSAKGNMSWEELAVNLETTRGVLYGCLQGNSLPSALYEKIRSPETDAAIIERLEDNFGRVKGGKASNGGGRQIPVKNPPYSEALAEAVGIMFGDGSTYANPGKFVYQVKIASNFEKEEAYCLQFVRPLFRDLFGLDGRIVVQPKEGVRYLCFYSRALVTILQELGVPLGIAKRNAGIPPWIKGNDAFLKACLRGLIDTDGSIFRLSRRDFRLIRIGFTNANALLLGDVRSALIKLGFHPSKIIQGRVIFITRKSDVARYVSEIGFNNPKNKQRLAFLSTNVTDSPVV